MIKKKIVITYVIIYIMLSILGGLFIKGGENLVVDGEYSSIDYENYLTGSWGYIYEGGKYVMDDSDPNLSLQFSEAVYGVRINFVSPVKADNIQFYYGRGGANYTESDSQIFKGSDTETIEMISGIPFTNLRIDINQDFGIRSIEIVPEVKLVASANKILYAVMYCFNVIVSILFVRLVTSQKNGRKCREQMSCTIRENKKVWFIRFLQILGCVVATICVEGILSRMFQKQFLNPYRVTFLMVIFMILLLVVWYRKSCYKNTHVYVFSVMMLLSTALVIILPPAAGITWDDEIHYGRTAYFAWDGKGISHTEKSLIDHYQSVVYDRVEYTFEGRENWKNVISHQDEADFVIVDTRDEYEITYKYVSYIPAAIAFRLGRGLGLDFLTIFMLGKWINGLVYSLIIAYSVKILERGKLLVAAIGCIPTNLMLASSYSQDWWVTAVTILGFSLFLSEIQQKKQISTKRMLVILLCLIVAMLPKAIYFPLLFPLMLFKKERYQNPRLCRFMVVVAMLILAATFVIPTLFAPASEMNDMRGGSDIDAGAQIQFILTQPIQYTKILLSFLYDYLALDVSYYYLTYLGYMGTATHYTLCIIVIAVCCVMDNIADKIHVGENILTKLGILLGGFGSLVLSATALYITFTPVAYHTVLGCQWRYIIPVLFPVLVMVCRFSLDVSEKIKKNVMMFTILVMSFVNINGIYMFCLNMRG